MSAEEAHDYMNDSQAQAPNPEWFFEFATIDQVRDQIATFDPKIKSDIHSVYSPEFLKLAAALEDFDASEFKRLGNRLRSEGLKSLTDWEIAVRRIARAERERIKEVQQAAKRAKRAGGGNGGGPGKGTPEAFDPSPSPVDGLILFDDLCHIFNTYMATLTPHAVTFLALWSIHTYAIDAADVSPILAITSPMPRCGKSRLLDLLEALVFRCKKSSGTTASAMFRSIDKHQPTLLNDECDTLFTKKNPNPELRAVFNAGNRRGATIERCVGDNHEPTPFNIFCPKATAAIGKLPETLEDRSIEIRLERRTRRETIAKLRRQQKASIRELRPRCLRWATDNMVALTNAEPTIPSSLDHNDRAAEFLEPLFAIADALGPVVRNMLDEAGARLFGVAADHTEDYSMLVLGDIYQIFEARRDIAEVPADEWDRITSADLCELLAKLEERPWPAYGQSGKPINQRQLAELL
jgi:putative DNA primase/helicase